MSKNKKPILTETDAMKEMSSILEVVSDEAKPRVISWLAARFNVRHLPHVQFNPAPQSMSGSQSAPAPARPLPAKPFIQTSKPVSLPSPSTNQKTKPGSSPIEKDILELKDIGKRDKDGVKLLIKDIKAANAMDAVFRLSYLICFLRMKLLGQYKTPQSEIFDCLKKFKAFDENTQGYIDKNNFLQKEGSAIVFSGALEGMARAVISQLKDKKYSGAWKPGQKASAPEKKKAPAKIKKSKKKK